MKLWLKNKLHVVLILAMCLVAAFAFAACGETIGGGTNGGETPAPTPTPDPEPTPEPTPAVVTISVAPTSAELVVGETVRIVPTVENSTETVTYKVEPAAVATVAADGTVTAVFAGAATVTATVAGKSATAALTVVNGFNIDETDKAITIYNADGLNMLNARVNAETASDYSGYAIKIKRDIDMGNTAWTPLDGYKLIDAKFDGENHTIKGLTITETRTDTNVWGTASNVSGFISSTSVLTMKDITFEDIEMDTTAKYSALVVGYLEGIGTFSNVNIKNSSIKSASPSGTGGFVGYINNSTKINGEKVATTLIITGCTLDGVTVESARSAGLVGRIHADAVFNQTDVPEGKWSATIANNVVINSTFKYTAAAAAPFPAHWATNYPSASIGNVLDSANKVSNNKYLFNEVEYTYADGTYAEAKA